MKDLTLEFERLALALFVAYRALMTNETPVACIFFCRKTGRVLSYGCNDTNRSLNGTRHAEFMGIDKILSEHFTQEEQQDLAVVKQFFSHVTLYVTVEPCIMCASALKQLGIGAVVFGCANDRFGGNGTVLPIHNDDCEIHDDNYNSYGGVLRTEAVQLLRNFYIQENDSAPVPKVKKNKELENKLYPPNLLFARYMSKEAFSEFYGDERIQKYYGVDGNSLDITPKDGHGYYLEDLITIGKIKQIPHLDGLYSGEAPSDELLESDLARFLSLFYPINDDGSVDFEGKKIAQIDDILQELGSLEHKKRKLQA